uniref:UDENN domain-containing protein n=1 Tax=Panagrolaimus sp. JU765 TaxID=591449 RepID=A0AC34QRT4_9BILA
MTTDTDLTLVDYFAVVGLDKTSGLKPDPSWEFLAELSGTVPANERLPPLERAYQSKVLAHFPEKRRGLLFPPEISSLCMPKGLKFYTETKVPMNPEFHSFVITREDGTRMNGCALTLFEEVKDDTIKQAMFDLQMAHVKQLAAAECSSGDIYDIKDETIKQAMFDLQMAHVKQLAAAECSSGDIYDSRVRQQPGTVSFGNHTMPRHISAKRNRQKRISYYDNTSKPIFVSKCIALLTRIPMVFTPEKILRTLAEVIKPNCHSLPVPLESFIYWVLHEVPLPIPGTTLQLNYSGIDLIVIRPPANDLPFFDYPLQHLFKYVSVDKLLKLFTCFLLEHQILLCSKHMDRL